MKRSGLFEFDTAPEPRRVIDFGWSSIKLALVKPNGGQVELIGARRFVTLEAEGRTNPQIEGEIQEALVSLGDAPIVVIVPSHQIQSHWVDSAAQVSGLRPDGLRSDVSMGRGEGRWIAEASRSVIEGYMGMLGALRDEVVQVVSTGQAMAAAHRYFNRTIPSAALVDVGAGSTVVALLDRGRLVFEGHFPIAGEAFVEAASRAMGLEFAEAERWVMELGAPEKGELTPKPRWMDAEVRNWGEFLARVLEEGAPQAWGSEASPGLWVVGGGSRVVGVAEEAERLSGASRSPFPEDRLGGVDADWTFYLGVAGAALTTRRSGVSDGGLAPPELASQWRQTRMARAGWIAAMVVVSLWLVLSLGAGIRLSLELGRETRKLNYVEAMEAERIRLMGRLAARREEMSKFEGVLDRWGNGWCLLGNVGTVTAAAMDQGAWVTLIADDVSYQTAPPFVPPVAPTPPGETNAPPVEVPRPWTPPAGLDRVVSRGLMAEVVFQEARDASDGFDTIFGALREESQFQSVDRRSPVETRVLVDPAFHPEGAAFTLEAQWNANAPILEFSPSRVDTAREQEVAP